MLRFAIVLALKKQLHFIFWPCAGSRRHAHDNMCSAPAAQLLLASNRYVYSRFQLLMWINMKLSVFRMQAPGVAFLLDIDGVLVRGHNALPCALPALQAIQAAGGAAPRSSRGN